MSTNSSGINSDFPPTNFGQYLKDVLEKKNVSEYQKNRQEYYTEIDDYYKTYPLDNKIKLLLVSAGLAQLKHNVDEAITLCSEVISIAPKAFEAHTILSDIYFQSKKLSKSKEHCLLALGCFPNLISVSLRLAKIYIEENNFNDAMIVLKQIKSRDSKEEEQIKKLLLTCQNNSLPQNFKHLKI
jgi:tetratricopeptide (TPR) repeat protein